MDCYCIWWKCVSGALDVPFTVAVLLLMSSYVSTFLFVLKMKRVRSRFINFQINWSNSRGNMFAKINPIPVSMQICLKCIMTSVWKERVARLQQCLTCPQNYLVISISRLVPSHSAPYLCAPPLIRYCWYTMLLLCNRTFWFQLSGRLFLKKVENFISRPSISILNLMFDWWNGTVNKLWVCSLPCMWAWDSKDLGALEVYSISFIQFITLAEYNRFTLLYIENIMFSQIRLSM